MQSEILSAEAFSELKNKALVGELGLATFAGGCFWCTESSFLTLSGVIATQVGYTGGTRPGPTYEAVCSSNTGHAEGIEIIYNPEILSYRALLDVFFRIHDPTQLNRQGADIGTQYRSAIFYHSAEQEKEALEMIKTLETAGRFAEPIVTEVLSADIFYRAEEYHQQYNRRRGVEYPKVTVTESKAS